VLENLAGKLKKGKKPMMNDLIADALTRIRNASMRKLETTTLMHSNIVEAVCNVLKEKEYIGLEKLYIDGTKIEANANRYTFVWRGSVNYHLVNLLDHINESFATYNAWIKENKYDKKYLARKEEMFYVEGSEKAKEIIEENRKRKKKDKKKKK
jgi:ribosomal protein S8